MGSSGRSQLVTPFMRVSKEASGVVAMVLPVAVRRYTDCREWRPVAFGHFEEGSPAASF